MTKFKLDCNFLLENAIRNDDTAKAKFAKTNALTYQMNWSCEKLIKVAVKNKENRVFISLIEAHRNITIRDLYKLFQFNK